MYYVIIEFDVKPEQAEAFVTHWSELTEYIRDEAGGLGSRLHKSSDGRFIAYAQWPNKKAREEAPELSEPGIEARKRMNQTINPENTKILLELNTVSDLLLPTNV